MFTADHFRNKAAECAAKIEGVSSPGEIRDMRRLEQSFLTLADNEEWLVANLDKIVHSQDVLEQRAQIGWAHGTVGVDGDGPVLHARIQHVIDVQVLREHVDDLQERSIRDIERSNSGGRRRGGLRLWLSRRLGRRLLRLGQQQSGCKENRYESAGRECRHLSFVFFLRTSVRTWKQRALN